MSSVCRICLSGNLRLRFVENELISVYDRLTTCEFNSRDPRSKALCGFCYQKLLKCYTFCKTAQRSEWAFGQLLADGVAEVNQNSIAKLNLSPETELSRSPLRFYNVSGTPDENYYSIPVLKQEQPENTSEDCIHVEESPNSAEPTVSINKNPFQQKINNVSEQHEIFIKVEPVAVKEERLEDEEISYSDETMNADNTLYEDGSQSSHSFEPNIVIQESNINLFNLNTKRTRGKKKLPFVCSECDKTYQYKSDFIIHMRKHTGEKPYACTLCDKRVSFKSHLKSHMRVHAGEKPFVCTVCDTAFYQKSHLQAHMRIHTGEKPYGCTLCDEQFAYRRAYLGHMRTHTGEKKPFACTECDKSFSIKRELLDHIRTHTGEKPFECPNCVKKFRVKSHLLRHLRIHTGDKPHACSECDKKFIEKQSLISHMHIHTGEKRFACPDCDRKFSQKSNLTSHKKTHSHPKKSQTQDNPTLNNKEVENSTIEKIGDDKPVERKVDNSAPDSDEDNMPLLQIKKEPSVV